MIRGLNRIRGLKELTTNKKELKMGFVKFDDVKNRLELITPSFILGLGRVLSKGAKKYPPNNWKKCEDTERYKGALLRHIFAYLDGEKYDPETKEHHLYHAGCNIMFLLWFDEQG